MEKLLFCISKIIIAIECVDSIKITEKFKPFKLSNEFEFNTHYTIKFLDCVDLPKITGNLEYRTNEYLVYEMQDKYYKCFLDQKDDNKPYAISKFILEENRVNIIYLRDKQKYFSETDNCFFHIGWEKLLIHSQRLILHAACVLTNYGGILFSGISGSGKSTQADLWCKYEDAHLINGDRTILQKDGQIWLAHGSPYAGSSKCYKNEFCKIKAIVMVKQANSCSIRKLGRTEAFQKIFSGLTVNSWDRYFVEQASDLVIQLIQAVSIYELECTPDKNAVDALKKELDVK